MNEDRKLTLGQVAGRTGMRSAEIAELVAARVFPQPVDGLWSLRALEAWKADGGLAKVRLWQVERSIASVAAPPVPSGDAAPMLRLPDVLNRTGLTASQIAQLSKANAFPRPMMIDASAFAWVEAEVDAWTRAQPAARPSVQLGVVIRAPRRLVSSGFMAAHYRVTTRTIKSWVDQGRLTVARKTLGGQYRFHEPAPLAEDATRPPLPGA